MERFAQVVVYYSLQLRPPFASFPWILIELHSDNPILLMNFLEEFRRLQLKAPRMGLQCVQNENSPYCQYTEKSRNCYMTYASYQSEDCMYNHRVFYCTDCNDCTLCQKCELCYECVDCVNSYNSDYCYHCKQVSDSLFCHFCIGCKYCFGCVGLRQAEYHIFNEKFSKEEYEKKVAELSKLPAAEVYKMMWHLITSVPVVSLYGDNNEGCSGENIYNCKDSYWAFDSKGLRDCYYVYHCDDSKDLYDCSHLGWSEVCYEIMSGGNLMNCMFCYGCWYSNDLEYCDLVYNSHDCFLCVSLNHASYCILNKEYSEEEYKKKVAEIKTSMKADGTWGQWYESGFPVEDTLGAQDDH